MSEEDQLAAAIAASVEGPEEEPIIIENPPSIDKTSSVPSKVTETKSQSYTVPSEPAAGASVTSLKIKLPSITFSQHIINASL